MPPDTPLTQPLVQVAVPSPLYGVFDYLPPPGQPLPARGSRVRVPFGRQHLVGVVMALAPRSEMPAHRLKHIEAVLDGEALLGPPLLGLLEWAAGYYQHPLGEVISTALPTLLRQGEAAQVQGITRWRAAVDEVPEEMMRRAPRQAALLHDLIAQPGGLDAQQLNDAHANWRAPMGALVDKALAAKAESPCLQGIPVDPDTVRSVSLNPAQAAAAKAVISAPDGFAPFLLEGVTGSGKTEVYLSIIEDVVAAGRQALVLVPEIGLTPQLLTRFQARFERPIAVLHSGLTDRERLCAWLSARSGEAPIVIGTRSAVFTPLANPGVILVDEEHDLSFKQQDGLRYHARDLAVMRARRENVPVVLGSATPALESINNARKGGYRHISLPERAGVASHPEVSLLDVRRRPMTEGMSDILIEQIHRHLDADGQVLLFLNRRGYAPVLQCHDCGWAADCPRCDAHMTYHARRRQLVCHHCGVQMGAPDQCPGCGSAQVHPLGQGTERIETALQTLFPEVEISRIDRDTTRRKGAIEAKLEGARSGQHRILVGTQMLAKGHDFPGVTLVGILDIDQGLLSADFRATERMAQLITQVAGRAGRAERPGHVLIQTRQPDHPLLLTLIHEGYRGFCRQALEEREAACLPPFSYQALIRAESPQADHPLAFLGEARELFQQAGSTVQVLGPVPAPMERLAGRYRAQLLLQAETRAPLHQLLSRHVQALASLPHARRVRWSLDVDPMELF
ncbi:MAG: primosomal protein N' [Gammaproteobacteria bacterium]